MHPAHMGVKPALLVETHAADAAHKPGRGLSQSRRRSTRLAGRTPHGSARPRPAPLASPLLLRVGRDEVLDAIAVADSRRDLAKLIGHYRGHTGEGRRGKLALQLVDPPLIPLEQVHAVRPRQAGAEARCDGNTLGWIDAVGVHLRSVLEPRSREALDQALLELDAELDLASDSPRPPRSATRVTTRPACRTQTGVPTLQPAQLRPCHPQSVLERLRAV